VRADQIDVEPPEADPEQVRVGVVEAGHDAAARELDHARRGADERRDLGVAPDGEHAVPRDGHGRRQRPRGIERVHPPAAQHEVRRSGARGRGHGRQGVREGEPPERRPEQTVQQGRASGHGVLRGAAV
jgi:hypothetical protein